MNLISARILSSVARVAIRLGSSQIPVLCVRIAILSILGLLRRLQMALGVS